MNIRKKDGLGRRRIAKKLKEMGYPQYSGSIQDWLNGRKPIIKEFRINDKLTEEKAFVLGVIGPGDGYVRERKCGSEIGLAVTDKDFAIKFKDSLEKIYGFECKFKKEKPSGLGKKPRYRVLLYSVNAVKNLKKYGVNFKEFNWSVPVEIKKAPKKIISRYVSGFFDSQGCVSTRRIEAFSKNNKGLGEIELLLKQIGLRCKINGNKIMIYSRNSLEEYCRRIGFCIRRKQDKLYNLIKDYKRYYTTSDEADNLIPEINKYLNMGYSKRKTAEILNISPTIIKNRIELLGGTT